MSDPCHCSRSVGNAEELLDALRDAQDPSRRRNRFCGVGPALLREAFHGFFLPERLAALVAGFERRGEA